MMTPSHSFSQAAMHPAAWRSIRWKLPLSYAAIALLAALALGAVLLLVVNQYYAQQQHDFLVSSADYLSRIVSVNIASNPDLSQDELREQIERLSVASGVRVALFNPNGTLVVDSGQPQGWIITSEPLRGDWAEAGIATGANFTFELAPDAQPMPAISPDVALFETLTDDPGMATDPAAAPDEIIIQAEPLRILPLDHTLNAVNPQGELLDYMFFNIQSPGTQQGTQMFGVPVRPSAFGFRPLRAAERMRGRNLTADSPEGVSQASYAVTAPLRVMGRGWGGQYLQISDSLNLSEEIIVGVARGWALASAVAVALAAMVGWLVSRHISQPLLALTAATEQMMHGDLSARADIRRRDEIGTLAASFNAMAARVETTVGALRHFVADAAHEIHTPLTALRTNLELLAESPDPASARRALAQAERLQTLADDLLDLSRLEADASGGARERVDLARLVTEISELYASRAEQADLEFSLELADREALCLNGHPAQLRRALGNLLDNAIKFTPAGGCVALHAQHEGDWAIITVEDSGIGIPADDLPLLFSRFRRGRNTASYPGSGLGLAIVRAIIDGHRGAILAESDAAGTRFTVRLPTISV